MTIPVLDEEDKLTAISLLVRLIRVQQERNRVGDLKRLIDEQYNSIQAQWIRCRDAFTAVGFDTDSKDLWTEIKTAISLDAWNAAFERARANPLPPAPFPPVPPAPPPPPPPPPMPMAFPPPPPWAELRLTSRQEDDGSDEMAGTPFEGSQDAHLSVREFTLEALRQAGPFGTRAADIRTAYEAARGTKLHDKTIGMTLYRLSKEDPPLVRREGRDWFFVEPNDSMKNPGGGTPGLDDLL